MRYYLKKCGFQELGSVKNGKAQRGRYLLTSMSKEVLGMFPPLSEAQLNDSALLPVIPLYSGKKVYCTYVYHNDKFHGSTAAHPRNEYRIYLNKELEEQQLLFSENDIIIMRAQEITEEDETQTVYYLDYLRNNETALYDKLDKVIESYPINGGYGIFEGIIPEFEEKVSKLAKPDDCEVAIDNTVTNKIATSVDNMASLFNTVSFRDFIMVGYDNLCAITGMVIRYESYMNLEAAHIKPKSHGGLFLPNNGMALCRDLHWAFDKGFFTLDDDLKVVVHPKIESEYLNSFNGKQIRIPSNQFFVPDLDNVRYHRENVYGLFLTTGKL
ncbi:HNH endonuclease [Ruminococcus bicirculans (ex Wegman et al. 2014)]|uniref:HNH endonuclease n=1 Tax=Ruminococcus bicirculans (ex Wegman et al. 2014) TaxID=1160721 RepID=UPI003FD83E15